MKIKLLIFLSFSIYFNFGLADCNHIKDPEKFFKCILDEMEGLGEKAQREAEANQEKMLRENLERMKLEEKRKKAQQEYEKSDEYKKAQKEKEARNKKAAKIREKCAKKAKDYKNESAAQDAIAACLHLEGYWD